MVRLMHVMGLTGRSAAYNIQTYTLNHTSIGIDGRQIASHITRKQQQLQLSKLHSGVELPSKFSTASLAGEAEGRKNDRADQQDNQFVHNLH